VTGWKVESPLALVRFRVLREWRAGEKKNEKGRAAAAVAGEEKKR